MTSPGTTPRIAPGGLRETGPAIWAFSRVAGRAMGTQPPAVFTTLGRGRGLFWGWLHFAGRLMPGGRLPRRSTELLILRVAHVRGSAYEFAHHVALGRRAGVVEADVERVKAGPAADGWDPAEHVLLQACDELLETRDVSDATWAGLVAAYDERRIIELLLLVGHYDMLATTLNALRLQPDQRR